MPTSNPVDRSYKNRQVRYPDGIKTNVLKVRRIGNGRKCGSIFISEYNMKRLGWEVGNDLELLVRTKDKMAVIWKREGLEVEP